MSAGKTIARIEEGPYSRYGHRDYGTVLIHFTDGTALKVEGFSHEEVDQSLSEVGRDEIRRMQRASMGEREKRRQLRLKRQAFDALPEEEKERIRQERLARMDPMQRVLHQHYKDFIEDQIKNMNRQLFGLGSMAGEEPS